MQKRTSRKDSADETTRANMRVERASFTVGVIFRSEKKYIVLAICMPIIVGFCFPTMERRAKTTSRRIVTIRWSSIYQTFEYFLDHRCGNIHALSLCWSAWNTFPKARHSSVRVSKPVCLFIYCGVFFNMKKLEIRILPNNLK